MTDEELKDFMAREKLTEVELANILGVTRGAVTHWLKGRRDIPSTVIRIITYCELHDLDIRDFNEGVES